MYVWSSDAGISHTSTEPPPEAIEFVQHQADGFELLQDIRIVDPLLWRVVVEGRFPPQIKAYWNSRIPGGVIGSGFGFWRELFRHGT